jgi:glycosyltransferase involved in cell wall biosynthesis
LVQNGVEVHAILPDTMGGAVEAWQASGAILHFLDCSLPLRAPRSVPRRAMRIKQLVEAIRPDIIHTHHVTTTLMLRLVLGKTHPVPRLFQVPGPLHLEHWYTRKLEMATAGASDFWIASSRCILRRYESIGVTTERLFLSYYSADTNMFGTARTGYLRKKLGIPEDAMIVGNINLIYPPKRYLGHTVGLKCHEDVIEAIRLVQLQRKDVWGVLVGGTFGSSNAYQRKLCTLAARKGRGRILMPGGFSSQDVASSWPDFDCAVHVPSSENCGGVVEALLSGVPTIAGDVGGLPEIVLPGQTGTLVAICDPKVLAAAVLDVLGNRREFLGMAARGLRLAKTMFDPIRCSSEVLAIYRHILLKEPRHLAFSSERFLATASRFVPPEVLVSCSA